MNSLIASGTPRTSMAEELPDELLEKIIRGVGPLHSTSPPLPLAPNNRNPWLRCLLVCRRWYRITIPYHWQFTRLSISRPGILENFCNRLLTNMTMARTVESVSIGAVELYMDTLVSLLQYLPRLRYLRIFTVKLIPSSSAERPYGHHKLEYLEYDSSTVTRDRRRDGLQWEAIQLLQLFDEVAELELGSHSWFRESHDDVQSAIVTNRKPNVYSLKLGSLEYIIPSYLTCLHNARVFDHITCLSVWCSSLAKLDTISEMLSYVGATLGEFYLHFHLDDDEIISAGGRAHAMAILRSGFESCITLHGFRVHMDSNVDAYAMEHCTPKELSEIALDDWLLALDLFTLLAQLHARPQGGRMRHLAFRYNSHQWRHEGKGFEILPWEMIRTVTNRFIGLASLTVIFEYPRQDMGPSHIDGAELTAREYTLKELQNFKEILYTSNSSTSFFNCTQESCRWHSAQHARRIVSLEFDDD
ncbi:hypothetical protein BC629DRAFT_1589272 [Irpex lacteus]|nr:hypothetical protein BC629DRAFT_1589272 [Irpex lacteus]